MGDFFQNDVVDFIGGGIVALDEDVVSRKR